MRCGLGGRIGRRSSGGQRSTTRRELQKPTRQQLRNCLARARAVRKAAATRYGDPLPLCRPRSPGQLHLHFAQHHCRRSSTTGTAVVRSSRLSLHSQATEVSVISAACAPHPSLPDDVIFQPLKKCPFVGSITKMQKSSRWRRFKDHAL